MDMRARISEKQTTVTFVCKSFRSLALRNETRAYIRPLKSEERFAPRAPMESALLLLIRSAALAGHMSIKAVTQNLISAPPELVCYPWPKRFSFFWRERKRWRYGILRRPVISRS